MIDRLAYFKLVQFHFGGNMRQIFVELDETLKGEEFLVSSKRTVYTGVRIAGGGNYEDYDPPYLSNPKAHVILKVLPQSNSNLVCNSYGFEIEAKNCQKVEKPKEPVDFE
jgi:hypothetical protein